MAVVDGTLLRIYIGGTAIAYSTSSTLNLTTEVDEIAPTSASAANFTVIKPRRKGGSISTNALYGAAASKDFKDLYDAWENDTQLSIAFKSPDSGEWEVSSNAYVTSLSTTGAVNQDATLRATFSFSGSTSITTVT